LVHAPPRVRRFFTNTGTMLQVRNLTLETHCARLLFITGEDKHAAVNCKAGIDDSKDPRRRAPRQWRALFCILSLGPAKEYVAAGGRNPRVLGQPDADDQDRGRCTPGKKGTDLFSTATLFLDHLQDMNLFRQPGTHAPPARPQGAGPWHGEERGGFLFPDFPVSRACGRGPSLALSNRTRILALPCTSRRSFSQSLKGFPPFSVT
jgi:hypothetical protein